MFHGSEALREGPVERNRVENSSSLSLAKLKDEDVHFFARLVRQDVSRFYPETEDSYALRLAEVSFLGKDPFGLFSLRKTIWSLAVAGRTAGFFAATEKRGGSVKFGPVVLLEDFRGKGLGKWALDKLSHYYGTMGSRKAYLTVPAIHERGIRFARKCGFLQEAQLRLHYSPRYDEVVFGMMVEGIAERLTAQGDRRQVSIGSTEDLQLNEFILRECGKSYDELDEEFTSSLASATARGPLYDYSKKVRKLFSEWDDGGPIAILVSSPKRGGAVKLGPVCGSSDSVERLAIQTEHLYFGAGRRKICALLAADQPALSDTFLRLGYTSEGRLREPFKVGVDMLVLSKMRG